jgi:hypothetical protein
MRPLWPFTAGEPAHHPGMLRTALLLAACAALTATDPDLAVQQAGSAGKYALLCLWRGDGEVAEVRDFRSRFATAAAASPASTKAVAVQARVDDPASAALVKRLGLERAPLPLILAVAPNGAVTRAYPQTPEDNFAAAFVGPGFAGCIKAMQDGKLAVLRVGSEQAPGMSEMRTAADTFAARPELSGQAAVIAIDPTSADEAGLLQALGIDASAGTPLVALVAPPGRLVTALPHPVTSAQLDDALASALAGGCGPSCGTPNCP